MNQLRDMWWSSRESCNRSFGSDVRATTRSSNEQQETGNEEQERREEEACVRVALPSRVWRS